jgi:radical SAM/Cys-rich protein
MVASFQQRLQEVNPAFETFASLQTLQVNLGNLCNLHCSHCHVNASLRGTEVMAREVMEQVVRVLARYPDLTLDITGGCPEMNPDFRAFVEQTAGVASRRLLRSNLAIMAEQGWEWLPEFCRDQGLIIIGSLPCYHEDNVDRQRGSGVYRKCIQVLKRLNVLGYGTERELDLVYNPGGDFVPGSQQELETAYKAELSTRHGIIFNRLFTITNAPIGRFREQLEAGGRYADYLRLLARRFNPDAAGSIMCRTLLSVDWQGKVYNCDFNQAMGMPITVEDGSELTISRLDDRWMAGKLIRLAQHCYCCTAGEGSSCTGALVA